MKRKISFIILIVAICVLALVSCGKKSGGGGSSCDHTNKSYSSSGSGMHTVNCSDCGNVVSSENCVTADGKCGLCTLCGATTEHKHESVQSALTNASSHFLSCRYCDDVVEAPHSLSKEYGNADSVSHNFQMRCYTCGYSTVVAGDHTTENGWQTNEVAHWKSCDDCDTEFEYAVHELADGKCLSCEYEADSLPVSEGLEFTLSSDETYYILTKINVEYEALATIVIPATYNDKPVKAIGTTDSYAIVDGMNRIKALYIPDGITTINDNLFGTSNYANGLVYVRLPETLTYIGDSAFRYSSLGYVNIPGSVETISGYSFANIGSLRKVVINEGTTTISGFAFGDSCTITDISLPSTITSIALNTFANCDSIESITLGQKDPILGTYENQNNYYTVTDNCLIERGTMALVRSSASMSIPSSVKKITAFSLSGDGKFYRASNETQKYDITLPLSIVEIEEKALSYPQIATVKFDGSNAYYAVKNNCLYDKESLTLIWGTDTSVVPSEVVAIADYAFSNVSFGEFTIPANVKEIGEYAFYACTFVNVTIENGVESINFNSCSTEQNTLTIPGSIKVLGRLELAGVEKFVLEEGVEEITKPIHASVSLPSTIKKAHKNNRYSTDGINITEYEGAIYFGDASNPYYVLLGTHDTSMTTLVVHPDTKVIADEAFTNVRLTSVQLNEGLKYIGKYAFANTRIEGNLVLPSTVKGIYYRAFVQIGGTFSLTLNDGIEEFDSQIIDAGEQYYLTNLTPYGNFYYLGTESNPYFMLVYCDTSWGVEEWTIHADTKAVLYTPCYPTYFDGTISEWKNIYKSQEFIDHINTYWDENKIECSDGSIGANGETYGLKFTLSSNGSYYLVSAGTAIGNIIIPEYYKGLPVKEISTWGFADSDITSVTLPSTLTVIGKYAFSGASITEITIPDSVESIMENAFSSCSSLTSVTMGKGVKRIEAFAFDYSGITSLTVPDGIEYFNSYAVKNCSPLVYNEYDNAYYLGSDANPYNVLVWVKSKSVTSCEIHSDTVIISNAAFEGSSIRAIEIPDSIRFIQTRAFQNCKSLTSVTVGSGVKVLDDGQFLSCDALTSVEFCGNIEVIGYQAFSGCKKLKSISLPASITMLDGTAFEKGYIDYSTVISYEGTVDEWNQLVQSGRLGDYLTNWSIGKIICSDGEIVSE